MNAGLKTTIGIVSLMMMAVPFVYSGSFHTASKPSCPEVVLVAKGKIDYQDSMKSGEFGFHHCMHKKMYSQDFPVYNPNNPECHQVDVQPEVVSIYPPLPHESNQALPVFGRPNPYFIPNGSVCEVKYVQYYYRP